MASGFTPPEMKWNADDIPDEFKRFKQYCNLVFSGPFSKRTEAERASYILLWIGRQGVDIYNSFVWDDDADKTKPKLIWERFEKHLAPRTNCRLSRYQLQQLRQFNEESIDDFMTRCRNQASKCKFRDQRETDERLIEQLIIGTRHKKAQERILEKDENLTLDQAVDCVRTYEATLNQVAQLNSNINETQRAVHAIGKSGIRKRKCGNCGSEHEPKKCPAHGSLCNFCNKPNHWSKVCRLKASVSQTNQSQYQNNAKEKQQPWNSRHNNNRSHSSSRQVQEIDCNDDLSEQFDMLTFETITVDSISPGQQTKETKDEAFVTVSVNLPSTNPHTRNTLLKAKLDTGAQANIIPIRMYRNMFPQNIGKDGKPKPNVLKKSTTILTAYGGTPIPKFGTCHIQCAHGKENTNATFYVTDAQSRAIIGLPTALELKLISLNCSVEKTTEQKNETPPMTDNTTPPTVPLIRDKEHLIAQYSQCFDGIGKFQGEYHITLDPTVPPVIHSPRRVPISLKDDIRRELEDMVEQDIVTKVKQGEPTLWVNSLVYRRKPNGKLRICLDPKDLNSAIQRDHHVTPTLEEILPKLSGSKYFSILDARSGYWNVVLDQPSSYLTTFNSPFGRYRFKRMPFGLRMSQDVFQAKIDQTFEGCEGIVGIADDIVVFGKTPEEHDRHLNGMIKKCQETGLKLNPDKCFIKQTQIKFFGIICGADGIKPDTAKVSALKQMKSPTDRRELQTFLGLATYMGPFIQNLSILTAPLREILKENRTFEWNADYQAAFDQIKKSISDEITLNYFDSTKEVTLQVDASLKGLGAALIQDGKPVAFASKALTDVETRYANIERELLAVVYGCERFNTYLFGRPFTVHSDHKPLESIHLKHLTAAPPRLQRMLLRLQPYDLTIKYVPGKDLLLADALSRLSPEEKPAIEDMNVQIHEICPQFGSEMIERIKHNTNTDEELVALKRIVYDGWPSTIKQAPQIVKPYWSYRDELSIDDGILLKGHRIIIPPALRGEVLKKLHATHQGAEKTKLRAKTSVFWRNINEDIANITRSCAVCQESQTAQCKEPLMQTEIPPRPWHTIATDLFHLEDSEYLLISDYYSKYPFVRKIPRGQSNSKTIIQMTKQIFSEHGVPSIVRSDNGPQYFSHEYREFAQEYGFEYVTSSPHYPRSNGFIESQVKSVKAVLAKAKKTQTDANMALLCLRATPIDGKLPSPAELLLGRKIQDNLPRAIPRNGDSDDIINRLEYRQEVQKYYHDQHVKSLPPLHQGQTVTIRDPTTQKWSPAIVKEKIEDTPRSYQVTTPAGGDLRRNRVHIRSVPPPKQPAITDTTSADQPNTQHTSSKPCSSGITVTRSGRIVKPPDRYI